MSNVFRAPVAPLWKLLKPDPNLVDFWLTRFNRAWSTHEPRARIIARHPETDGVVTLVLKPNRHFKGFRAGQHVNVSVEVDGAMHTRSYSASDAPRADKLLRITVKAEEAGKVSRRLQQLPIGTVLPMSQAFGEFVLPDDEAACVLLAAGSGITPILSLLNAQAARAFPRPIALFYWARTRADWIQSNALRAWASRHANFELNLITTAHAATAGLSPGGRISEAHVAAWRSTDRVFHVLACGASGFVSRTRELLAPFAASFQAEAFSPPQRSEMAAQSGTVQVTLQRSGQVLDVPRDQPLLEALEAQGLSLPHGCRMGICNTCACGKAAGGTRDVLNGRVDDEPTHALRLCIHAAQSDLVLEL